MKRLLLPGRPPSGSGTIADTAAYWAMWKTVVSKYSGTSNVYFEVYNEPHGYSVANLTNLYASWLSRNSSAPAGRVLLDGAGYATDVNDVGADSRLTSCLLSYHNYTWFNNRLTTSSDWESSLQSVSYPSRTIMTEFGAPMTTGDNYLAGAGTNRDIAYIQGVTNQLRVCHQSQQLPVPRCQRCLYRKRRPGDPVDLHRGHEPKMADHRQKFIQSMTSSSIR